MFGVVIGIITRVTESECCRPGTTKANAVTAAAAGGTLISPFARAVVGCEALTVQLSAPPGWTERLLLIVKVMDVKFEKRVSELFEAIVKLFQAVVPVAAHAQRCAVGDQYVHSIDSIEHTGICAA